MCVCACVHPVHVSTDVTYTLCRTLEDCPGVESMADDPCGLKVSLFPHQKQGLAWTQWRERQSPGGGILGKASWAVSLSVLNVILCVW